MNMAPFVAALPCTIVVTKMRNYNTILGDNNTLRESVSKRICEYHDLGNDNLPVFLFDWMIAWPFKALALVKWFSVNCLLLL